MIRKIVYRFAVLIEQYILTLKKTQFFISKNMKKLLLATALFVPLLTFAQSDEGVVYYDEDGNYYDEAGNYLVDYDGQDDKEKKSIKYNPVFVKYVEGSEDLDFYRPRNIEGASAQLAEETRRNNWLGRYIYNIDDPKPNEIRPENDPIINSGENADNKMLFNKKRDWLYYDYQADFCWVSFLNPTYMAEKVGNKCNGCFMVRPFRNPLSSANAFSLLIRTWGTFPFRALDE